MIWRTGGEDTRSRPSGTFTRVALVLTILFVSLGTLVFTASARAVTAPVEVEDLVSDFAARQGAGLTSTDAVSHASNLGAPSTPSYGPPAEIGTWRRRVSCAALSAERFVVAYNDFLGSGFGVAIAGAVDGKAITWGPPQVFNSATTRETSTTGLSATRFAIAYKDVSINEIKTVVGDVNAADNTLEFHEAATFSIAATDHFSATGLSPTKVAVAYEDYSNSHLGTAIIGDVAADGTLTFDPAKKQAFADSHTYGISVTRMSQTRFAAAYEDNADGKGRAAIGDVAADNTIAFGSEVTFNESSISPFEVSVTALTSTRFVVAFAHEGHTDGAVVVGDVATSATEPVFGAKQVFNPGETKQISAAPFSSSKCVVTYADTGNSYYGTSVVADVSGDSVAFGPEVVFSESASENFTSCAQLNTGKFVVAWTDTGSASRGKARIGGVDAPAVTTAQATSVATDRATLDGNITSVGGEDCGSRGFRYRKKGSGPWASWTASGGSYGTGSFSHTVTGLTASTTYEFKAFASNTGGTGTGSTLTFTTKAAPPPPPPPPPSGSSTWYLAEGTTAWGFSTYISIQNPNSSPVSAKVTLMPKGGPNAKETINLPPSSQTTLSNDYLASKLGGQKDFSTKIEAGDKTKTIAADRTMAWSGPGASSPEAHSSIGVTSPARTWYLPEGSTNWGFETWLLVQNPNEKEASCSITYMIEGKGPQTVNHKVPANSRESFSMKDDIGQADASIKVDSDVPVIPERAMYRYDRREGHDSIGTTTPAKDFYLAEGAVGYDSSYTTYVLVQNPHDSDNEVTITYQTGEGEVKGPSISMKPNSRTTLRANDTLAPGTDVSTRVKGSKTLIAERAMYWSSPAGEACHDSVGMSSPAMSFYLPDGQTSEGRETWTLVQNPNGTPVEVTITYMSPSGEGNTSKKETIPANSRKSFNMLEHSGIQGRASIMVEAKAGTRPVMVERAMYWNDRGAGTDTIGGAG